MLTLYALTDNSSNTEDVYETPSRANLYLKLTDLQGKTLIDETVDSLEQAIHIIENYPITDVEVSYNVDVRDDIYNLAHEINKHYLT